MKKGSIGLFLVSFIIMLFVCVVIIVYYAFSMAKKSNKAINEIGTIYMQAMNDEITMHFQTTIELRLNQVEAIAQNNPADSFGDDTETMLESLEVEGHIRNFNSLALLSADGDIQMIFGEQIKIADIDPFLDSLNKDEKKVSIATNASGVESIMLGISTVYPMEGSKTCTALIAGIPVEDVEEILSFDREKTITYSSIIKRNGDFIVKNYNEEKANYFDRVKELFTELDGKNYDEYIEEIQSAMAENQSYSTVFTFKNERRHLYCSPLANSEWYILTVMPYGELDGIVNDLANRRLYMLALSLTVIMVMFLVIFILYYKWTNKQIDEIEKARQTAIKASHAKSEFLSNMSHDIRTPMNAIVGMTEIACSNIDNKPVLQNCLKKITQSNKHLLGLINDILDMSKIESGNMELNMESTSLRKIMDDIATIIQQQIKAKNQHFDIAVSNVAFENVFTDSVRLNQVIINLLSNAVKFTQNGGSIHIAMSQEASPRGDEYVRVHIFVKDNGIGMSEEFKHRIFESFAREDNKRVQKTEGTGLGMAITKYIIDAMEGTIEVESESGKGTQFHVTVDMKKDMDKEEVMQLPQAEILVVDDNEDIRTDAVAQLKELGLKPESAPDAQAALQMVREHHRSGNDYRYVLMDWHLPEINGIDASAEIHELCGSSTTILLASAYNWSEHEKEARSAGVEGFISKPLFKSTLYDAIAAFTENADGLGIGLSEGERDYTGVRLLIAEDNDLNWEIASELLGSYGFETVHAENGQLCVEMFSQSPVGHYQAILMDIRMPIMTGYEAARAIRKLARADSNIPIIAMTADAFSDDIKRSLDAGMNAHVPKPIDIEKVVEQIDKFTSLEQMYPPPHKLRLCEKEGKKANSKG